MERTDLCPIIYHLHDIGFQCFIQSCKIGIFFWISTNHEHKKNIGLETIDLGTYGVRVFMQSHWILLASTFSPNWPHGFTKIEFRIFQAITLNLTDFLYLFCFYFFLKGIWLEKFIKNWNSFYVKICGEQQIATICNKNVKKFHENFDELK